jgi:cobalt/nickel transport system permease protein
MPSLESSIHDLGWLDQFATRRTPVHRVDPRAKTVAVGVYLVCVVSFSRYELLGLVPFVLFPVALASQSGMPGRELWRRVMWAAPFALAVGIFNPLLDRTVIGHLVGLPLTGGWVSFASICARVLLTTSAAVLLIGTTGMQRVCAGIERLGVPDVFTTQLLLLYRYIFVLVEETLRLSRARSLRSFGKRGMGMTVYGNILGHLLLRTIARAQRVYEAMRCRGFDLSLIHI